MSLDNIVKDTVKGHALNELQGLNIDVLAGAGVDVKLDLAAIRTEDTLVSAIVYQATGLPVDDTANVTIESLFAVGTLTLVDVVADDVAIVNGNSYTFKVAPVSLGDVLIGADDTEDAANLAAAINAVEKAYGNGLGEVAADVVATSALGVVTLTAAEEGTGGNSIAISAAPVTITASGANLAGGTATGGVSTPTDTTGKSVVLTWFNKQ